MNRKLILSSLFIFFCLWNIQAEEYETMSPNGMLKIKLRIDKGTTYEIWHGNEQLIASSPQPFQWYDYRRGNGEKCYKERCRSDN